MNSSKKRVCILYRTNSILPADEPEMNRQRTVCLSFARQKGWLPHLTVFVNRGESVPLLPVYDAGLEFDVLHGINPAFRMHPAKKKYNALAGLRNQRLPSRLPWHSTQQHFYERSIQEQSESVQHYGSSGQT